MRTIEVVFLIWFTVELTIRIIAHRMFFFWCEDMSWNIFDFVLVLVALVQELFLVLASDVSLDTTFMRSLRILKVGKALRVLRMVSFFNELRMILNSLIGCVISLFWSIIMLLLFFFMFGIAFVQSATNWLREPGNLENPEGEAVIIEFSSVQQAMLALFRASTGGDDWAYFYDAVAVTGATSAVIFLFFVAFSNIAFLNIITALFTERAISMAQPDRAHMAAQKRRKHMELQEDVQEICKQLDVDENGDITAQEFHACMKDEDNALRSFFEAGGHDLVDAELFFNMQVKAANGKVRLHEFINGCMKLEGDVNNLDIQVIVWQTQQIYKDMHHQLQQVNEQVSSLQAHVSEVLDSQIPDSLGNSTNGERDGDTGDDCWWM
jgi:hypothetical protein